ncbi:hypothetical protein GEV33_003596 [Tenebrio molitor]|uniref:Uncharacterized protein n=1 Tax=Tenebrio molitor TaxID=7067 RepID=A0A8J6HR20_TENMO|nr:hypothetical protein GEV33_003596 [Tenebrio molitor]
MRVRGNQEIDSGQNITDHFAPLSNKFIPDCQQHSTSPPRPLRNSNAIMSKDCEVLNTMMTGTPGTNRFSLTTLSRKVMKARAIKATPKINRIPHSTVIVPNEKFTRSQNVTIRRNIHLQQRLIKGEPAEGIPSPARFPIQFHSEHLPTPIPSPTIHLTPSTSSEPAPNTPPTPLPTPDFRPVRSPSERTRSSPVSDPFAPLVSEPGHPAHPVFPARSLP